MTYSLKSRTKLFVFKLNPNDAACSISAILTVCVCVGGGGGRRRAGQDCKLLYST